MPAVPASDSSSVSQRRRGTASCTAEVARITAKPPAASTFRPVPVSTLPINGGTSAPQIPLGQASSGTGEPPSGHGRVALVQARAVVVLGRGGLHGREALGRHRRLVLVLGQPLRGL